MLAKGSLKSLAETLCLPRGLSLMVKPARCKKWTAPGTLQGGRGKMSRGQPCPPGGLPEDLCLAAPVRTSPS